MSKRKYPIITIVTNRTIEGVDIRKDISVVRYKEARTLLDMLIECSDTNVEKIDNNHYVVQSSWLNSSNKMIHLHLMYIVE